MKTVRLRICLNNVPMLMLNIGKAFSLLSLF